MLFNVLNLYCFGRLALMAHSPLCSWLSFHCSSAGDQKAVEAAPLSIPGARQLGWPLRLPPIELVRTRPPQKLWLRRPNLLRLNLLSGITTITWAFACRGKGWRQWIMSSPRRCSTRCLRALDQKMQRSSSLRSGAAARIRVAAVML